MACMVAKNVVIIVITLQEPVWYKLGTHIGCIPGSTVPTNIEDGFYYVPLNHSLTNLLKNENVLDQVCEQLWTIQCTMTRLVLYLYMYPICTGIVFSTPEFPLFRRCNT